MANVYGRVAKISNAVGRSNYINDKERQEEIVLQKTKMQYSWLQHSEFEKENQKTNVANNEALEVHIALPNNLYKDKEKLEMVCDDLAYDIVGENKDFEYAVHWNHNRTNLHVHILFSERECQKELVPKVYKKDIWQDKDTHKLAKANSDNAELVHKKGEVQKDKDGNIKYQTDIFMPKDKKFIESSWVHEKNRTIEKVLKTYGYDLEYREKENPYLSQKKLYKGASKDYLDKAKQWNDEVKKYNSGVKEHIEIEPEQLQNYVLIKKEIVSNVKEANAEEKKISERAIELVRDMSNWIRESLIQLKASINRKAKEYFAFKKWNEVKDKFSDLFDENKKIESEIKELNQKNENYKFADKELEKANRSKTELIDEIEKDERRKARRKDYEYDR